MTDQSTAELSVRELEILRLIATGASNKEIAQQLVISTNTVKVHVRNIFTKINVTSRTEAAMYAVNAGLVSNRVDYEKSPLEIEDHSISMSDIGIQQDSEVISYEKINGKIIGQNSVRSANIRLFFTRWKAFVIVLLIAVVGIFIVYFRQSVKATENNTSIPLNLQRWKELADLPSSRTDLAIATDGENIFVIGGKGDFGVTGEVDQYIPESNTWVVKANKPTPVFDAQAAYLGGNIYIPGGRIASDLPINTLEIYHPADNVWSVGKPLPVPLSAYGLVTFEGKLYVFGGWNGKEFVDAVFEFDPAQNQWNTRTPLPSPRGYVGAVVAKGRINVLGGYDGKQALTSNDIYNPSLDNNRDNPWSTGISLPEGRYSMGVASVGDIIHVVGGKGNGNSALSSLEFPPQANSWQPIDPPTSNQWSSMGAAPLAISIFAIGGEENGKPLAINLQYQVIYTILIPFVK